MNTRLHPPVSRLICLGGAKASTNQGVGIRQELNPDEGFDD
ncbi:hypothetical protein [Phenylobacterium zucineum]|nr:hypothetical protein [Phenylobacterium zucineum]